MTQQNNQYVTPAQVAEHGLSEDEYETIRNVLGR